MSETPAQNEPQKGTEPLPPAAAGPAQQPSSSGEGTDAAAPVSTPSPDPAKKVQLSGECVFNESITVYSGNRIPHYDKGPVKAYFARGTDKAPPSMFALICEDHLSPRTSKAGNYASIINPSLPRLVASGIIDWAPTGRQKYCFLYENVLGQPIMREDTKGGLGLKTDLIMNAVIRPMISVFQDFRDKDIVHGNIRPANLYDGGGRGLERAILGECLATPVSYMQPSMYEPIERALASSAGRGTGSLQDDLYSFGVTLAMLLRHDDPNEHLSEEEIIERKMEEGSYITLLGKERLSGAILELLRGLLYDDEGQRWTLDDVLVWMDGRRLSPKQAARRSKANRPVLFNGEKYIRPEMLARDLSKNVGEARQLIDSGEMEQWLSRALEDKLALARYENALKQADEGGKGPGYAEQLVTRLAIALHPEGPIRFKSINVMPDGVGAALIEAYCLKRDIQSYVDFFMYYFITQWIDAQSGSVPDVGTLIGKFDGARAFLRQKGLGGGLEKCLYTLNPEIHCLSEKLQKFHVRTPEDMMIAFEKMSSSPGRPAMFMDRHIAAFLSVKDRKNIDPYLHDMNAPEPYRRILAEMKTLATIQKRSQMPSFPGIAAWMIENLEPVYERFHDRELREDLRKKAEKLRDTGDLAKLVTIFDTPATYQEDNLNFRRSMRKYHELEEETVHIEKNLQNEETLGKDAGRQIAAIVAGILAGIIVLTTGFMTLGH